MGRAGWIQGLAGATAMVMVLSAGGCGKPSGAVPAAATTAAATASATAGRVGSATGTAASPAPRRVNVLISGHVQGVGFRAFTEGEARRLGLSGWVMNLPDGRVQAVIEGPPAKVASLLELLRKGPPGSRVDAAEISEQEAKGDLATFEVRQ